MSLDNEGSAEVSETVSTSETSSESKGDYSVTDPGYGDASESTTDDLAALIAENKTENKPPETSDDASEADGDTEEDAEKPPAESAAPEGISDELLDRATELGYTIDEIKGFRSEKSLEKEVARVEKLQQRLQERQAAKAPPKEPEPVEETDPEPNWAELLEAGHDPDNIALQQKVWQRAAKAEALVKQVYQAEQQRSIEAQCQRFDESLNSLGKEYESLIGNGRYGDLRKSSPELASNRQKVFDMVSVLKNSYQAAGTPVPSEDKIIQVAIQATFPDQTTKLARQKLKSEIKEAGSQSLSRPRSSGGQKLSGEALASQKERDFWKSHT